MGKAVKLANCMFCHRNCGALVHIEDGQVIKVEADPNQPMSRGNVCHKLPTAIEFHYHADRLKHPLKRIGDRGEGKWERTTWEQALDEIAEKLSQLKKRYGAETLAMGRGTYRTYYWAASRFLNLFGTPNMVSPGTICFCNTWAIHQATYGAYAMPSSHAPAIKGGTHAETRSHESLLPKTKCVVIWGFNPIESYPVVWRSYLKQKRENRIKVITIDPRRTPAAKEADIWLRIRPCTDGALAMAWLNVIIEEELYDRDFVEKWTIGFDELKERVKNYTPEKVGEITWEDAGKIREAARVYAESKPAQLAMGVKQDQIGRNSTQFIRATCILRAITGNLDVPGGESMGLSGDVAKVVPDCEMDLHEMLPPEQRKKQLGTDRFRFLTWPGHEMLLNQTKGVPYASPPSTEYSCLTPQPVLWRAMVTGKPYPVRAFIAQGTNTLLQATSTKLVYKALKSLELLVVMDYFMTPTAMLADYVLPAADWLERPIVGPIGGSRNYIVAGERAVEPEYERQDDYYFWRELGVRVGQGEHWPWKTLEDVFDYRFKPIGYSLEEFVHKMRGIVGSPEFRKYETYGFATPSKKVEIHSKIFEELGYDPLPDYEEPADSPVSTPELAKDYPLILTTGGRVRYFYHSEFRQIKSMRNQHPEPLIDINTDTARKLGIMDGKWVWIETPVGRVKKKAKLNSHMDPKVVHTQQHGWWFPEEPGEEPNLFGLWKSNINVVLDDDPDKCDPMTGGWPFMGMCRVYPVKE